MTNLNSHKHIVFLQQVSQLFSTTTIKLCTYLLVSDGELASGNLVILSKGVQVLHRLTLRNRCCELDVGLGVLVSRLGKCQWLCVSGLKLTTYVNNSIIRQRCEAFVQGFMHFLGIALKESPTS
jgi:hypothetical protein